MKEPLSIVFRDKVCLQKEFPESPLKLSGLVQCCGILLYKYLFAVDNVYSFLWIAQAFAGYVVYVSALWGRGYLLNARRVTEMHC